MEEVTKALVAVAAALGAVFSIFKTLYEIIVKPAAAAPAAPAATAAERPARGVGRVTRRMTPTALRWLATGAVLLLLFAGTVLFWQAGQPDYRLSAQIASGDEPLSRVVDAAQFTGSNPERLTNDDDQTVAPWIVDSLVANAPLGRTEIPFQLRVPADLRTGTLTIGGLDDVPYRLHYRVVGTEEYRLLTGPSDPRLREIGQDFELVIDLVGYRLHQVGVIWEQALEQDSVLVPKRRGQVYVLVEDFKGDDHGVAADVHAVLADDDRWIVFTEQALQEAMERNNEIAASNPAILLILKEELEMDFRVRGTLTERDSGLL